MSLSRREALGRIGLLVGGVLSASTASAFLAGCQTPSDPAWTPSTLTSQQNEVVATIAEHIIPASDTPGARDARVNAFIDEMLTGYLQEDDRAQFLEQLAALESDFQAEHGVAFLEATPEQQIETLTRLDAEAMEAQQAGADPTPFMARMKYMTIMGYYTSPEGATEELHMLVAPGRYDGCVPLSEVGKAWA